MGRFYFNGGTPSHHPFLDGLFPNKNQPFLDTPHDHGNRLPEVGGNEYGQCGVTPPKPGKPGFGPGNAWEMQGNPLEIPEGHGDLDGRTMGKTWN